MWHKNSSQWQWKLCLSKDIRTTSKQAFHTYSNTHILLLVAEISSMDIIISQWPIDRRSGTKLHIRTKIIPTTFTIRACPTRDTRFNSNPITYKGRERGREGEGREGEGREGEREREGRERGKGKRDSLTVSQYWRALTQQ